MLVYKSKRTISQFGQFPFEKATNFKWLCIGFCFCFVLLERFVIHLLQGISHNGKIRFKMPDWQRILGNCSKKHELWNHKAELFKYKTTPISVSLCHQWVKRCPFRSVCTKSNYIWYVLLFVSLKECQIIYKCTSFFFTLYNIV